MNSVDKELLIVTGLSGSGKSVAMSTLEDLGYYCVDNLPLGLVDAFLEHHRNNLSMGNLALGLDVRSQLQSLQTLPETLAKARRSIAGTRVFFLSASEATLLKRYSETRRRHPLHESERSLAEAIHQENEMLMPVADHADVFIDTSSLSVHQLRREICNQLGVGDHPTVLLVESYAFKQGVPADVDFAFDVRCLPNPHWEPDLRPLTGREAPVKEYLSGHTQVNEMVDDICRYLDKWLPEFEQQQRSYLTIGIGCTGGKHRSVYVAERIAEHFSANRDHVLTYHRELI
ncbi:MAG: RNase adapter RapZ [Xanthomonadales bacterium]|nr:RNase adapter RapZ [Xanthomonadales bacterium]